MTIGLNFKLNPDNNLPVMHKVPTLSNEELRLLGFASNAGACLCLIPKGSQHLAGWS